tara:strand:+ start:2596 stop:4113 length:1518 start_codon:yes stop_codon:yes gene_type:complete
MSLFDNIAKVIGLGDKHAGYGVIEGVGDTATQIIKDDDERLNDNISRLTALRQKRLSEDETRYNSEFKTNFEQIKALSADLGPNGTDILHGLITENDRGFAGAKSVVPLVVQKAASDNITAEEVLGYTQRKEGEAPITNKELAELITDPIKVRNFNLGDSLKSTGNSVLNFIAGEGAVEQYAEKEVKKQMALAGFPEDFGQVELSDKVAPEVNVDLFELSLVGSLTDRLNKILAAANKTNDPDKKTALFTRANEITVLIDSMKESPLNPTQLRSNKTNTLKKIAENNGVLGQWDNYNKVWITMATGQERYNQADALSSRLTNILQFTKKNRRTIDGKTIQALLPLNLPNKVAKLYPNQEGGVETSMTVILDMAAQAGMDLKIVMADDSDNLHPDKQTYVTFGDAIIWAENDDGSNNQLPSPVVFDNNLVNSLQPQLQDYLDKIVPTNTNIAEKVASARAIVDQIKNELIKLNLPITTANLLSGWKDLTGQAYNKSDFGDKEINQL